MFILHHSSNTYQPYPCQYITSIIIFLGHSLTVKPFNQCHMLEFYSINYNHVNEKQMKWCPTRPVSCIIDTINQAIRSRTF